MDNINKKIYFLYFMILLQGFTFSNIVIPHIFGNGMVLQQKSTVKIWGWAKPKEPIKVHTSWNDSTFSTEGDPNCNWEVKAPTPRAGGPYVIKIQGYNQIELTDVLIGEVWLCSGQSNIEWSFRAGVENGDHEVKNAVYPNIRFFNVRHRTADSPQLDIVGSGWSPCTPETTLDFSAISFAFGKNLHNQLNVPIGLINSSWGGTPAEIWTNPLMLQNDTVLAHQAKKIQGNEWGAHEPGKAYYTMIEPLKKFKIAGAIWYQGESNVSNGNTYDRLLSTLVKGWRNDWGYDFPFYYVQIAPWAYGTPYEGVIVRNAQSKASRAITNAGMVVISDLADTTNIHPKDKMSVGLRLANVALNQTYHQIESEVFSPIYNSHNIKGQTIEVVFSHANQGLVMKGKQVSHFEIAGEDRVFRKAEAKIDQNKVIVKSKNVKSPKFVRFAWSNTAMPNLYNKEGLPASCFTTLQ